ncbi:hypothetical protein Q7C36_022247 [Tachysurus vachellii]|uniref:Immunoglobulin domain-containing protein n=1 Tax=Tachysurus vachellii TaxID=175792 RepID=A0AA88IRH9_TACVA|nr:hypothetical protein Q7C36_022247 [Tachysurus vachellii]
MYQFGDFSRLNYDINLKVNSDPCCSGTKAVTGQLGQTLMISCFYPVEFETNPKSFYRLDGFNEAELIRTSGTEQHQDDRFSISDDRKNKVFSVNITDLRKDDGGLYSCAFTEDMSSFSYQSFFTVFQLQATEVTKDTAENPDGKLDTSESGFTTIIIITLVICVILLLGVVSALIFYKQIWKKLQGTFDRNVLESLSEMPHYDEIKDHTPHADTEETEYYSVIPLHTIPSVHPNAVEKEDFY